MSVLGVYTLMHPLILLLVTGHFCGPNLQYLSIILLISFTSVVAQLCIYAWTKSLQ